MADLTNEQAEAPGRRWLAAGGGWRAGMLVQATLHGSPVEVRLCFPTKAPNTVSAEWPDLRDPATLGAALDVVRERWGDPCACVRYSTTWESWYFYVKGDPAIGAHPTEAHALVAALEAAPKER